MNYSINHHIKTRLLLQPPLTSSIHLQQTEVYGGFDAAITFGQIESWIDAHSADALESGRAWDARVIYVTSSGPLPEQLAALGGRGVLDLTPGMILARGAAVDTIVAAGIAEYCNFQTLEASVSAMHIDGKLTCTAIPVSKAAIFKSPWLSLADKTKATRFLSAALDTEVAEAFEDAQRANEATLLAGRSLLRPQNRPDAHASLRAGVSQTWGETMAQYSLEDPLASMLALCVAGLAGWKYHGTSAPAEGDAPLTQALQHARMFVRALGRFGSTACILPQYGIGELGQALCRSAAVHGTVYRLRLGAVHIAAEDDGVVRLQSHAEEPLDVRVRGKLYASAGASRAIFDAVTASAAGHSVLVHTVVSVTRRSMAIMATKPGQREAVQADRVSVALPADVIPGVTMPMGLLQLGASSGCICEGLWLQYAQVRIASLEDAPSAAAAVKQALQALCEPGDSAAAEADDLVLWSMAFTAQHPVLPDAHWGTPVLVDGVPVHVCDAVPASAAPFVPLQHIDLSFARAAAAVMEAPPAVLFSAKFCQDAPDLLFPPVQDHPPQDSAGTGGAAASAPGPTTAAAADSDSDDFDFM